MGQPESKEEEVFQAGGHGGLKRITDEPGVITKVGRGTEIEFYQRVQSSQQDAVPPTILSFLPKFYGLLEAFPRDYIKMEDLTSGMTKACVMDLKMGTQTWTDDAFYLKRLQLESRDTSTTSAKLGFRITGLRVYRKDKNSFDTRDKETCSQQTETTCEPFLQDFFFDGTTFRYKVLKFYLKRLKELLSWFREQNRVSFYSSSLLFVYDSDSERMDVRMIDFAHVKLVEGQPDHRDHGYITGLENLIKIFSSIRKKIRLRQSDGSSSSK